jgi:hypothetical protein
MNDYKNIIKIYIIVFSRVLPIYATENQWVKKIGIQFDFYSST